MFNSIANNIYNYSTKAVNILATATPIGPMTIASAINRFAGPSVLNAANLVCSTFSGVKAITNLPHAIKNLTHETINYFTKKPSNILKPLNRIAIDVYILYMSYYSIQSSFREGNSLQEDYDIDKALLQGLFVASIANCVQGFQIIATAAYNDREIDEQKLFSCMSWCVFNMYTAGIKANSMHLGKIYNRNVSYPFVGLRPEDAEPFTNLQFPNRSDDTVLVLQATYDNNGASDNRTTPIFYELYSQHKKVYFAKNITDTNFCSTIQNTRSLFRQLIDVLIMQAHGNPEKTVWDVSENKSFGMHIKHPISAYKCIDENLAPDAKIILISCEAGKKRLFNAPNIAEWTSQVALGRMVFASTEPIGLEQVRYSYKNKSLDAQFLSYNKDKNITQIYQSFKVTSFSNDSDAKEPLLNSFIESFENLESDLYNSLFFVSIKEEEEEQEHDDSKDWIIPT